MSKWIEITITITLETQEAIINACWELGANGVVQSGSRLSETSEQVTAYWPTQTDIGQKVHQISILWDNLRDLGIAYGPCLITTQEICENKWDLVWKKAVQPVRISETLIVAPPWAQISCSEEVNIVRINPGTGFGTGNHETTQLCLRKLGKWLKTGDNVLDIGTGSGVLSIAAAILGASQVTAIDNDPMTLDNAIENVQVNDVVDRVNIFTGDVNHSEINGCYQIVISNIDYSSLTILLPKIICHLKNNGRLILSGVLSSETKIFEARLLDNDLAIVEHETQGEWWGVVVKKNNSD